MNRSASKLAYIDAIRGIAILMVIFVHTSQRVGNLSATMDMVARYGQMGVQLFFVASAYTMCLTWTRRQSEPRPLRSFYMRRFFRIAPLYYVAILMYFAVFIVLFKHRQFSFSEPFTPVNIAANALFIHGFVPAANNSIVPGGWSIGTEMAFYLVFPLIFAITDRLNGKLAQLLIILALAMTLNLSVQMLMLGTASKGLQNNSFTYFSLLNQLPVFLIGIIAYWRNEGTNPRLLKSRMVGWACFAVSTLVALFIWKVDWPLSFALLPSVAALSFFFLLNTFRDMRRHSALLCRIGRVSYSMYVFHFLFAWVGLSGIMKRIPLTVQPDPDLALLIAFPVVTACTFLVALGTERLIERRGIAVGNALIACLQAHVLNRRVSDPSVSVRQLL